MGSRDGPRAEVAAAPSLGRCRRRRAHASRAVLGRSISPSALVPFREAKRAEREGVAPRRRGLRAAARSSPPLRSLSWRRGRRLGGFRLAARGQQREAKGRGSARPWSSAAAAAGRGAGAAGAPASGRRRRVA